MLAELASAAEGGADVRDEWRHRGQLRGAGDDPPCGRRHLFDLGGTRVDRGASAQGLGQSELPDVVEHRRALDLVETHRVEVELWPIWQEISTTRRTCPTRVSPVTSVSRDSARSDSSSDWRMVTTRWTAT